MYSVHSCKTKRDDSGFRKVHFAAHRSSLCFHDWNTPLCDARSWMVNELGL
jgi:hypothetical protein